MKSKSIILVFGTVLISLTMVGMLYVASDKKLNYRYASFERNFVENALVLEEALRLNYFNYYLAGHTGHTIYLGNPKAPTHLMAVNRSFADTVHYTLQVDTDSLEYRAIHVTVDSPDFYLSDGSRPFIYKGALIEGEATEWITDTYFIKAIPLSVKSVALISIRNLENTVMKKVKGEPEPEIYSNILEEQGEGIFSTDGMFLYDKKTTHFVYVYFYRNQYITMDSAFRSVMRGNTIDTITIAKIKPGKISSQNSYTMAAPPLKVNNKSTVFDNLLLVQSNLLAKNEDKQVFEDASVIDVYDLRKITYRYSFYLPSYRGQRAREFLLTDNATLIALYEPYLVRFRIKDIIAQ